MRYIVEITQAKADTISSYIEQGRYKSFNDFLLVALENQLFIESRELGIQSEQATRTGGPGGPEPFLTRKATYRPISEVEELKINFNSTLKPTEPPALENLWSQYLWGHYNRILPAKITLRVLTNLLDDSEKIDLRVLQEHASNVAAIVGTYLKTVDKKTRRKRWEGLSVGLPNSMKDASAISRFKLQFVGYATKEGVLHGMPIALRFMNVTRGEYGKDSQVGITTAGIDFAKLPNPIIDSDLTERTLSDEEIAFYLGHIRNAQPYELKAFETVVAGIENGQKTYDAIKTQIHGLEKSWSDSIVNTMCIGILSRMRELGIVQMHRDGLRSYYQIGPSAGLVKPQ
jgi:hypothetical protein